MTVPTQPVTIKLADFGGPSVAGVVVTARASEVDYTADGVFVGTKPVTGTTDVNGQVILQLFPNAVAPLGLGTVGTTVRVTAKIPGGRSMDVQAAIVNAPCNLVDVLVEDQASANVYFSNTARDSMNGAVASAQAAGASQADALASKNAAAASQGAAAASALAASNSANTAGAAAAAASVAGATVNAYPNSAATVVPAGVAVGAGYWVQSLDLLTLDRYKNVAGVATRDNSIESIATAASIGRTTSVAVPDADWSIQDGSDNAAVVLQDGSLSAVAFDADTINGIPRAELKRAARRGLPNLTATYVGVISYGQSLSVGANAAVHTRADVGDGFFDCLRFNANGGATAGPRAQEGSGTVAQNHASLVPYAEQFNVAGLGETPLGNAMRMVKTLLRDEDGIKTTDYEYLLIGSAPGQSNTTIANLSKGSAPYQRLLDDVEAGVALAGAAGKSFAVDVIYWSQGEADAQAGTSRATYAALLQQLYTDANTDIKARTGQLHDLKFIAYQMNWGAQPSNTIALAQLDVAKANDKIVLATNSSAVEHIAATDAHLTGLGSAMLGAYYGYAHKRVILDGETWPLLYPRNLRRQGNVLEFDMPDTGYPWAISTALFPFQANAGFTALRADNLTANVITSVTVVGPRRVRVVLTNAEAGKLRYGFATWGGNLHDTTPQDALTAQERLLYRPCLTFEEPFA